MSSAVSAESTVAEMKSRSGSSAPQRPDKKPLFGRHGRAPVGTAGSSVLMAGKLPEHGREGKNGS